MKLLVLHLSDLHIEDVIENKEKKINSIFKILESKYFEYENVLIIFTGDIAKSGKKNEYDYAEHFISEITSKLSVLKKVKIALCPGNHDRLFKDGEKRDKNYVESISKSNYEQEIKNNLYLTTNYEDFERRVFLKAKQKNDVLKLCDYKINDENLRVYCLNNALLSGFDKDWTGNDFNEGGIFIRNQYLDISRENNDYVFLLMHMPLTFLKSECVNYLKTNLSNRLDAIFTGHIHKEQVAKVVNEESEVLEFVSSAIDCKNMSGFSIVLIDDDKIRSDFYSFSVDEYVFKFNSTAKIERKFSTAFGQMVSADVINELRNMEIFDGINNINVPLDSLFVFPKLSHKKYSNQESVTTFERFESTRAKDGVNKVLGDAHAGKSQFTKFLFNKYRKEGFLPVICKGNDLDGDLDYCISKCLKQLYSERNSFEAFKEVPIDKRILIIDNLVQGSRILFRNVLKLFGSVIYTTTSSKDFISSEEEDDEYNFESFEIEPFYYDKRAALYEKIYHYVKETNSSLVENVDLHNFIQNIENKLKELDIDNVMDPSNIIYISFAYLKKVAFQISPSNTIFASKIKVVLDRALKERGYKHCDCTIAEDIISYVAMNAYTNQMNSLTTLMFENAIKERTQEYGGRVPVKSVDSFIQMLVDIEILKKNEKNEIRFYSRKMFAHFVSKFVMYRKNSYDDDSYLKQIIANGIYRPLNLQILFSIASNYEYRTIPEFFVKELYDSVMKEPEMKFGTFEAFFKTLDENDDDFKELEISKEKRNEIREKQGIEEEKNRKLYLTHKDDYYYYDVSKETFMRLDDLLNKALIISSIMNNFSSHLKLEAKTKLAEMLIKIPYAIINIYLADAINKLDIIFVRAYDQLSKLPTTKITYKFVKQSIVNEIHATILSIFDICTRFVRNPIIIDSVQALLSENKDTMHSTQQLMLLSFSTDRDEFVNKAEEYLKIEKDKFVLRSAALIGRRFCLDNYEWVEKKHGELLQLITKGNVKEKNSIREKSKRRK